MPAAARGSIWSGSAPLDCWLACCRVSPPRPTSPARGPRSAAASTLSIRTSTRSTRTSTPIPSSASRRRAPPRSSPPRLKALGYEVTEGVGRTGIVGALPERPRTDRDGAHRARRAAARGEDRAALCQQGKQMLRGVETPVMHACGHDIHMAAWVAVARTMLDLKDQWSGTLMFVGQPAEEGGGGAKAWSPTACSRASPSRTTASRCMSAPARTAPSATSRASSTPRPTFSDHLHRQGRPRLAAAHHHRSGDDGRRISSSTCRA